MGEAARILLKSTSYYIRNQYVRNLAQTKAKGDCGMNRQSLDLLFWLLFQTVPPFLWSFKYAVSITCWEVIPQMKKKSFLLFIRNITWCRVSKFEGLDNVVSTTFLSLVWLKRFMCWHVKKKYIRLMMDYLIFILSLLQHTKISQSSTWTTTWVTDSILW